MTLWTSSHVYVSPHIGTGPVLELGPIFCPVLELGHGRPHAPCHNGAPSAGTGIKNENMLCPVLELDVQC